MSTAGPTLPSTVSTRSIGKVAWTNPTNAQAEDGVFATCTENTSGTDRLRAVSFSWALPAGAIVSNILVEVKGKVGSGTANKIQTSAYDSSFNQYANSATSSVAFTTTNTWVTNLNASPSAGFSAVAIANGDIYEIDGYAGLNTAWSIDAIRVTLTYTLPGSTVPIIQTRQAVMRAATR